MPSGSAEHTVIDTTSVARNTGERDSHKATKGANYIKDTLFVAVPNQSPSHSTIRDSNKNIVENEVLTCADEIKQRFKAVFKETPVKETMDLGSRSGRASKTLPVNTKKSVALPLATMGSADPR